MELFVTSPDPTTYEVDDYDVYLISGLIMPITVNLNIGDTFVDHGTHIEVKMSPTADKLPAEDLTIYKTHVVAVQHRKRTVTEPTSLQQAEWKETLSKAKTGSAIN